MPLTIEIQVSILLCSLLSGLIAGALFDVFRIFRGFNVPKAIIIIEDLLFWSVVGVIVFAFLLYTDYAFLSVYVYIIIGLILLVYLKFISPVTKKLEEKTLVCIFKVFRIGFKQLFYPFRVLYKIISGKNNSSKKMS